MNSSVVCAVSVALGLSFLSARGFADEASSAPEDGAEAKVEAQPELAAPALIEQPSAIRPGPVAAAAPAAPAPEKPAKRVKSPAMIIVGSVLSGVGAAGLVTGGVLFAQADAVKCATSPDDPLGLGEAFCGMDVGFNKMVATAFMIAGGVHTAVGIPLIAVGSQAPKKQSDEAPAPRADLQIGATGATFTLTF